MSKSDTPAAVRSNAELGPFAELHEPETEFEDGNWHKPLPQGWSGGTLVYTEAQMLARVAAERERCARVCDDEARIRTEAAAHHGAETPEWGRCMAAARAAINCAKGCRNGEEV